MVKIKCHQYNAAIKIAANVNTFLCITCVCGCVSEKERKKERKNTNHSVFAAHRFPAAIADATQKGRDSNGK